jgi:hypothetical protein
VRAAAGDERMAAEALAAELLRSAPTSVRMLFGAA